MSSCRVSGSCREQKTKKELVKTSFLSISIILLALGIGIILINGFMNGWDSFLAPFRQESVSDFGWWFVLAFVLITGGIIMITYSIKK